jgi:Mg2+-importing ATPase
LTHYGANRLKPAKRSDVWSLLLRQFGSPIILILLFATGLSLCLGDRIDAFIILFIVLVSSSLGFWQERGASNAVEKLLSIVQIKAAVLRDGNSQRVPVARGTPCCWRRCQLLLSR